MAHEHTYKLTAEWTGNKGEGTKNVRTYDRSHTVSIQGKPELFLTTDNAAVGDKSKLNPEDFWFQLFHLAICFPTCIYVRWKELSLHLTPTMRQVV